MSAKQEWWEWAETGQADWQGRWLGPGRQVEPIDYYLNGAPYFKSDQDVLSLLFLVKAPHLKNGQKIILRLFEDYHRNSVVVVVL